MDISSKKGDEDHDQAGSTSSTPPGAYTPRPDPTDKRLPGLANGYFGQVREPRQSLNAFDSVPSITPAVHMGVPAHRCSSRRESRFGGHSLPTAPTSPKEELGANDGPEPLFSHERLEQTENLSESDHDYQDAYPTPPGSSCPSLHRIQEHGAVEGTSLREGWSRVHCAETSSVTSQACPPKARRHTFAASKPLHSVTTTPVVHAAHIENPALSLTGASCTRHRLSASRGSSPLKKLKKLTEGVTSSSPLQSTPPQTPRALSQENHISSPNPSIPGVPQLDNNSTTPEAVAAAPNAAAVKPPKGKLSVTILQGRGLRPSYDPYVVCQCQWNEYISKGPRNDSEDGSRQGRRGREISGGATIRRTGGDKGRPMAIPMRSRQSSHTSMSPSRESRQNQLVTDPDWNHEATL